jgi:hypothetical protein
MGGSHGFYIQHNNNYYQVYAQMHFDQFGCNFNLDTDQRIRFINNTITYLVDHFFFGILL